MPYRIVQIEKPHLYGGRGVFVTEPCYVVESKEYTSPEEARQAIKSRGEGVRGRVDDGFSSNSSVPEDWFIIIQTF